MRKQEAIKKLKDKLLNYNNESGWYDGYKNGIKQGISVIEELNETSSKVTVPKFVADWIKQCKANATLTDCLNGYYQISNGQVIESEDFQNWVADNENDELTATAWLLGYTVQKVSRFPLEEGDLVIRKGKHEAQIHIIEAIDENSILLVNGVHDQFYSDNDEDASDNTLDYFYSNFRLLTKKENLEPDKN